MEGDTLMGERFQPEGTARVKAPRWYELEIQRAEEASVSLVLALRGPPWETRSRGGGERRGHIGSQHFSLQGQEPRVLCRGRRYDPTRPLKGDFLGFLGRKEMGWVVGVGWGL